MKLIYRGAEAELWKKEYLGFPCIEKKRTVKKYRIPEIDGKIAAERIRKEIRLLKEAREAVNTPKILSVDLRNRSFLMEFIAGTKVKEMGGKVSSVSFGIGRAVSRLHKLGIVHGDLTTSNILIKEKEPYFIDFGLAERTNRQEDFAMDLLVFKKMLKSTHYENFEDIWKNFLKGYGPSANLQRKIKEIERRARYVERD